MVVMMSTATTPTIDATARPPVRGLKRVKYEKLIELGMLEDAGGAGRRRAGGHEPLGADANLRVAGLAVANAGHALLPDT
jgi:hypothetical protein